MLIINESGLYSMILSSRKPQAKPFKRWITGTVLPDIRKTSAHLPAPLNIPRETAAAAFFSFGGEQVRHVVLPDGDVGLVAKDVAERLGYTNTSKAIGDHCKGVTIRYPLSTPGGVQTLRIIKEPDVMRLIVSSTLPSAQQFEAWVFEELLPQIRKTGAHLPAGKVAIDLSEYERLLTITATRGLVDLSHTAERVESASKAIASDHARGLSKRKPQKKANKALQESVAAALQVEMFDGKDAPSAEQIQREADAVAAANSCPEIRVVAEVATTAINAIQAMAVEAMSVRRLH